MAKMLKDLLYLRSKQNLGNFQGETSEYIKENRAILLKMVMGGADVNIDKFIDQAAQNLKKKSKFIQNNE